MINSESGNLTPEDRAIMKRGVEHRELGMGRKIRALMGYQLDRRDAQLMLSLTQYQAHMPDGVAVAHRMVRGASGEAAGMFINGLWVNLA